MNDNNQATELSKRLSKINELIAPGYDHIWDCCCDHGLLGMALIEREAAANIHLVDVVPELINAIKDKLSKKYKQVKSTWQTHCLDAAHLPIKNNSGKHLIVISGIGGDLTRQIVTQLYASHPEAQMDFLLCPIRQHYTLRSKLRALNFKVKKEVLVEDKKRIYEVLLLTPPSCTLPSRTPSRHDLSRGADLHAPTISKTGWQIWRPNTHQEEQVAKRYLQLTIEHYTRMSAAKQSHANEILAAFKSLEIKPDTQDASQ